MYRFYAKLAILSIFLIRESEYRLLHFYECLKMLYESKDGAMQPAEHLKKVYDRKPWHF